MRGALLLVTALVSCPVPGFAGGFQHGDSSQRWVEHEVRFSRMISNIEISSNELVPVQPGSVRVVPGPASGHLWYGRVHRRLPGDSFPGGAHDVVFAAEYESDHPTRLWCDQNFNGDLSDDAQVHLYAYPEPVGARAGLVDLTWIPSTGHGPVEWKVRIVIEPVKVASEPPRYRVQMVYAMRGKLAVDGVPRRAFLFDGNWDGVYSEDYGDGVFVDSNGDRMVTVDPSSQEFLPFSVSAQAGGTIFQWTAVAADGESARVLARTGLHPVEPVVRGRPAPTFEFTDLDGRAVRSKDYRGRLIVLNFWASWCGDCVAVAPKLRSIFDRFHSRGLEVIGISFDRDREAAVSFVKKHGDVWPTSFIGRGFWENPIGRLYHVEVAGSMYLVDSEGTYIGKYADPDELERDIARLLTGPKRSSLE